MTVKGCAVSHSRVAACSASMSSGPLVSRREPMSVGATEEHGGVVDLVDHVAQHAALVGTRGVGGAVVAVGPPAGQPRLGPHVGRRAAVDAPDEPAQVAERLVGAQRERRPTRRRTVGGRAARGRRRPSARRASRRGPRTRRRRGPRSRPPRVGRCRWRRRRACRAASPARCESSRSRAPGGLVDGVGGGIEGGAAVADRPQGDLGADLPEDARVALPDRAGAAHDHAHRRGGRAGHTCRLEDAVGLPRTTAGG